MKAIATALTLVLCAGVGAIGSTRLASAATGEDADVAPPPSREERAPAPRDGYIWAPGYWDWRGHDYSWVPGRFVFERRGAHWVADRWDQVEGRWHHVAGHWEH